MVFQRSNDRAQAGHLCRLLLLAVALTVKPLRWWGLMGSVVLLSVFTTYVGLIWWNVFDRVPCNCAGFIEAMG
ncbi:MauE/DoxX family redox-associated membrane protein [Negadavirga shengliensis]|uniref:MauE/DoxX family redox-associated membrane protein n=1 Tax=Negadavirga shengliensis TaxID=1389218 RepID=A0ABV9SZZ1_9BACT